MVDLFFLQIYNIDQSVCISTSVSILCGTERMWEFCCGYLCCTADVWSGCARSFIQICISTLFVWMLRFVFAVNLII